MPETEAAGAFDAVVVGSGGGALTGAYLLGAAGLSTLVLESTDRFGGTTAYSGAGLWLPANPAEERAGVEDSTELAREYFRSVVGDRTPVPLQDAFLDAAPAVIAELERHPLLQFEFRPFPDYFNRPGGLPQGRNVFPLDIRAEEVGALLETVRPPAPDDRLGVPTRRKWLTGGQALISRLLMALDGMANVELRRSTALDGLVTDADGRVVAVETVGPGGARQRVEARRGVLLAAGGFERNRGMRLAHQAPLDGAWTMGAPGGLGRAIEAAGEIGADTDLMEECWWSPGILLPDGSASFVLGFRGGIIVDRTGRRFANESLPYDRFGRELRPGLGTEASRVPAFLVFDDREGPALPAISTVDPGAEACLEAGVWHRADTLEELAGRVGLPASALSESVARWNAQAAAGVDDDFGRGQDPYDRFFGTGPGPNPVLVPIEKAPFYAATVVLADLGTKGGLRTDASARVLRADGTVIAGLYAAGNTMASVAGHAYPGPGTPIGTCMAFAYLAARDIAAG